MAALRYWDGTQWVLLPGGAGDFVKRVGDLMSGPLTITDDGSENPSALLLYVAGEMVAGTAQASAVLADTVATNGLVIVDGAQPGFVWTATDDVGNGEWQPLTNITPGPAAVVFSDTPPPIPVIGMQWWDTSTPDVAPHTVWVKSPPAGANSPVAAGWGPATWPTWIMEIPCDGLLTINSDVLARPNTANCTVAAKVSVRSESGLVATELVDHLSYNIGRISGTSTVNVSDSSARSTTALLLSSVDPSGGTIELGWDLYCSTAVGTGAFRLGTAECRFEPYANERVVFVDLGAV